MQELGGRVAIVTGAARGVGLVIAERFVAAGAQVVLADVLEDEGQAAAQKLGASARFSSLDVTREADWSRVDHVAISYVLARRWRIARRPRGQLPGIGFEAFVRHYSALWKPKHTSRKRAIRALPWGPLPRKVGNWGGKRWDTVQRLVEKWGAGRVKNPCPNALHWGGTMDKPAGHWSPVSCGYTNNIFYTVRPARRKQS